ATLSVMTGDATSASTRTNTATDWTGPTATATASTPPNQRTARTNVVRSFGSGTGQTSGSAAPGRPCTCGGAAGRSMAARTSAAPRTAAATVIGPRSPTASRTS